MAELIRSRHRRFPQVNSTPGMRAWARPCSPVRWVGGPPPRVRRAHALRGSRVSKSDAEDTLSALERLVGGVSSGEAAESAEEDAKQVAAETSTAIVREVLVELEPPDNIAAASFEVKSASTRVVQSVIAPPLGVVFEQNSCGEIVVAEIVPGSNAAALGTVAIAAGDILRACSAMIPEMKYTTGGLMLGGNGRPGFRRVLFVTPTGDDLLLPQNAFAQTMSAITSNAKAGGFDVNVVVERREKT